MTDIHHFLASLWYLLLGGILMLYVITDGFDLGVGVLSLFERDDYTRDVMMAAIGGVWDANETWLVLFGGALFGAFPVVYATTMHALYIPVSAMLFGLIFRGVAFEFRDHARNRMLWNYAFGGGSLLAVVAQGYALGSVISGLEVTNGEFIGSIWSWLSLFSTVVAIGVAAGYTLLGGTYLVMKTEGDLQARYCQHSRYAAWVMLLCASIVTLATPLMNTYIALRWLSFPGLILFVLLPCLALFAFFRLVRSLNGGKAYAPFIWSLMIFTSSFAGLAASLYPYLLPPSLTLDGAASSSATLVFMLVGIGMLIPVMLVYNAYQYLVFRGTIKKLG